MNSPVSPVRLFILLVAVAGSLTSCAVPPRANRALGQLYLGNPEQAWQMISAELKEPTVSTPRERCEMHAIALQILSRTTSHAFIPPDSDQHAASSYDYIHQNCREFPQTVMLAENNYGNYFQNTGRPGQAVSHYRASLELCQKGSYDHMTNEGNLALCFADMGLFELRDFHRSRAIEIGRAYFRTRRTYRYPLDEFNEWNNFKSVLQQRMDELSWMDDPEAHADEMSALWKDIRAISMKWVSAETQYVDHIQAVQRFAASGDTATARRLLLEARELTRRHPYKDPAVSQLDLQCAEAKILLHEGKAEEAADRYRDWLERFSAVSRKSLSGNDYRLAGLAQEQAGKYDLAIEYLEKSIAEFERMRATFQVEQRSRVLSGLVVTAYWGLIRSYVHRYLAHGDEEDYAGALRIARMLRARQFGELMGITYHKDKTPDLPELGLTSDELLLNIVVTDKAVVIFALAPDWRELFLIPYEGKTFRQTAKKAKTGILNPGRPDDFVGPLQEISRLILDPVQGRLDHYRRIVVIPDGLLNGLPFFLLSKHADEYHPILFDHEVVFTPSISYFLRQRGTVYQGDSDRILALADPDYGSRGEPDSFRGESEGVYSRAVNRLNLFTPLPETRTEVNNLARRFQPEDVTMLLGKKASETELKSLALNTYRYLHLATHGILGNQIPGVYEPALVLATEKGTTGQDGYLTLSEVEKLNLNSDLAVLSACDTGSGEYFTGEGVMGLSRGFLLSGSRSVIVSLWPVASHATVELMSLFYENLRAGKSKAEALRSAQLSLMGQGVASASSERGINISGVPTSKTPLSHPFYWAPFVLIGD